MRTFLKGLAGTLVRAAGAMRPPSGQGGTAADPPNGGLVTMAAPAPPAERDGADALVRIERVTPLAEGSEALLDFVLDAPVPGQESAQYAFKLAGWILGRGSPVTALRVLHGGTELRTVPVNVPHPRPVEQHPGVPGAERCGFWNLVGVLGLPDPFEVEILAELQDGRQVPFVRLQGRRTPLRTGFGPGLQPLLVTALGRTGTTWLMRLLSQHPALVMDTRYPYELRIAQYWIHTLGVLAEPANHLQSSTPNQFRQDRYLVGHNPFYHGHLVDIPGTGWWLGRAYVERLALLVQQAVEGLYRQLAASQGLAAPRYFCEKYQPDHIPC